MPDPNLSDAIKEAYASCTQQLIYHTLEINYPTFEQPIRIVRDYNNLSAVLEDSAPYNAGELVTFLAYAFNITPPETTSEAVPQCIIELDNIDRTILTEIDYAVHTGNQNMITVIYRAYLEGNENDGPENNPPMTLTVSEVTANPFKITLTAGFINLANKKFPSMKYTTSLFPGLVEMDSE